ncbi:hypothetical protein A3C33_00155 [Candidatus Curtissbacteria bacterium RIFCSPHIGHO2_02_FULL_42_58]|nr:MAG: hypothetical protein A3C33_00155 [Candidatus Curtissbacteria bacterium RIFCSPHIGHO2_02_FULL_42_58]OGE03057.1 MAG: hypothetical protein A3G16_04155 [Candidatus Curtissbacteria bacterium RIFCSPLOWO2_12_FULL_41_16]
MENRMKLKTLLRPLLSIIFGIIGTFIVKVIVPPEIFTISGNYLLILAIAAFGILGFILPELVELAGRAGTMAVATQIVRHLPSAAAGGLLRSSLPFRKRRPGKAFASRGKYANPLILDTSALIDGRLFDIVKTGFIYGTFLVIPSVIAELHKLADSKDEIRRARGRRGLEVLSAMQAERQVKVEVLSAEPRDAAVDDKLVKLAKKIGAKIITVDYNLNKVAVVSGVSVLNINELANAVKTAVLPHERLKIQINAVGREKNQGVGYLADGTMVVVEGGANLIGKTVEVVVHRILQTAAGKMIFARRANAN